VIENVNKTHQPKKTIPCPSSGPANLFKYLILSTIASRNNDLRPHPYINIRHDRAFFNKNIAFIKEFLNLMALTLIRGLLSLYYNTLIEFQKYRVSVISVQ